MDGVLEMLAMQGKFQDVKFADHVHAKQCHAGVCRAMLEMLSCKM